MKVVVIGGGIGGTVVVRGLVGKPHIESVTLVEPRNFVEIAPGLIDAIFRPSSFPENDEYRVKEMKRRTASFTMAGKQAWGPKVKHVQARCASITAPESQAEAQCKYIVHTENGLEVKADILVIACGATMAGGPFRPGPECNSWGSRAVELAAYAKVVQEAPKSILVVGGGIVSVEAVCELSSYYPTKDFHLVVANKAVLEGLKHRNLARVGAKEVKSRKNIKIYVDAGRIALPETPGPGSITLKDGTKIDYDAAVVAAGNVPSTSFLPTEWISPTNKLVEVDKFLRVLVQDGGLGAGGQDRKAGMMHADSVYAVGDCTDTSPEKSLKLALVQGSVVVSNLLDYIERQGTGKTLAVNPPRKNPRDAPGTIVKLGPYNAALHFGWFLFAGFPFGYTVGWIVRPLVVLKSQYQTFGLTAFASGRRRNLEQADMESRKIIVASQ